MALSILTEHDDFRKARRALVLSSVLLLFATSLDLQGDFVKIFELKIGVSQMWFVSASTLSLIYFAILFIGYALSSGLERNAELLRQSFNANLDAIQGQVQVGISQIISHSWDNRIEETKGRDVTKDHMERIQLSDAISRSFAEAVVKIMEKGAKKGIRFRVIVDIIVPLIFAISAILYSVFSFWCAVQ